MHCKACEPYVILCLHLTDSWKVKYKTKHYFYFHLMHGSKLCLFDFDAIFEIKVQNTLIIIKN